MESHKDPAHDANTSQTSRTILTTTRRNNGNRPRNEEDHRGSVHRFRRRTGPERMWLPVLFHHHRDCIRICFCDCFRKRIGLGILCSCNHLGRFRYCRREG